MTGNPSWLKILSLSRVNGDGGTVLGHCIDVHCQELGVWILRSWWTRNHPGSLRCTQPISFIHDNRSGHHSFRTFNPISNQTYQIYKKGYNLNNIQCTLPKEFIHCCSLSVSADIFNYPTSPLLNIFLYITKGSIQVSQLVWDYSIYRIGETKTRYTLHNPHLSCFEMCCGW